MDLAEGAANVYLPHALARKYPNAPKSWGWQFVFRRESAPWTLARGWSAATTSTAFPCSAPSRRP
jgi:hypothetical protein